MRRFRSIKTLCPLIDSLHIILRQRFSIFDSQKTLRIGCPVEIRENRGFKFTPGIDDKETECGLDDYLHDITLENGQKMSPSLTEIIDLLNLC